MTEAFNDHSMDRSPGLCSFCSSSDLLLLILLSTKNDQPPLVFSPPFHFYSLSIITTAFVGVSVLLFWDIGLFIKPLCMFSCIVWSTHISKPPLNVSSQYRLAAPNHFPSILFHSYFNLFFSWFFLGDALLTWTRLKHNPYRITSG